MPRSIVATTDLGLVRVGGRVEERESCWVVHTPASPGFYWGNFLLFRDAPRSGDEERWLGTFQRELGAHGLRHCLLAWDRPNELGDIRGFLALGFELDQCAVLTTNAVHPPPRPLTGMTVRPLKTDAEWEEAAALQGEAFSERRADPSAVREFAVAQMRWYRTLLSHAEGNFYGGYIENRLAGTLGLFRFGRFGRYQLVGTHPEFRRRGVAGTLVYEVGREALATAGVDTLVMAADATYHAARVYESVGFRPRETLYALLKVGAS